MKQKTIFVLWPRRLAACDANGESYFTSWVWLQQAMLVNNINHGWIAFIQDQTPEKLARQTCPKCGRETNP